jgi:hypothetical protein
MGVVEAKRKRVCIRNGSSTVKIYAGGKNRKL